MAGREIAGASARTLARLFESELDLSFTAWRQRVRFHNALEAIARNEPIERIAADNGYRSPSAFSAAFRSVMGHAPTASHPGRPRAAAHTCDVSQPAGGVPPAIGRDPKG